MVALCLSLASFSCSSTPRVIDYSCPLDSHNYIVVIDACNSVYADKHTALGQGTCEHPRHADNVIGAYKESGGPSKIWLISYAYKKVFYALERTPFAEGMAMARQCRIPYVNISGGGEEYSTGEAQEALAYTDSGGIIFASAGNNSSKLPFYPAALKLSNLYGVGAYECYESIPASYSNYGIYVDTWENGCYNNSQGTSFASPRALARWQLTGKLRGAR